MASTPGVPPALRAEQNNPEADPVLGVARDVAGSHRELGLDHFGFEASNPAIGSTRNLPIRAGRLWLVIIPTGPFPGYLAGFGAMSQQWRTEMSKRLFLASLVLAGFASQAFSQSGRCTEAKCGPFGLYDVREARIVEEQIVRFTESLNLVSPSARVLSCELMIDLPVGTARGNHSYGAYCQVEVDGVRRSWVLCNDQMVGHFALASFGPIRSQIAQFTYDNCTGG